MEATVRPPMRQEAQVKALEWTPMVLGAEVTMVDMRAADGVARTGKTQEPLGPLTSLGKRGGQTVQRLPGRLLQFVLGRLPARSMKRPN